MNQEILLELHTHETDMCALSETKIEGNGEQEIEDYILSYSGADRGKRVYSGMEVLIRKKCK